MQENEAIREGLVYKFCGRLGRGMYVESCGGGVEEGAEEREGYIC